MEHFAGLDVSVKDTSIMVASGSVAAMIQRFAHVCFRKR
jgi:hypothetical protein